MSFMVLHYFVPTLGPVIQQILLPLPSPTCRELFLSDHQESQTIQEKLLRDLRGGDNLISEYLVKMLLIWTMALRSVKTTSFQPNPNRNRNFNHNILQNHIPSTLRISLTL